MSNGTPPHPGRKIALAKKSMPSIQTKMIPQFPNASFSKSERQDIISNVEKNMAMYLSHKNLIARYVSAQPPIIAIAFPCTKEQQAYAKGFGNLTYEIGFSEGLLVFFRHFSIWLSNSDAFPSIAANRRKDFADYMMYCWADMVGYHEWSHIIMGHSGQASNKTHKEIPDNLPSFGSAFLQRALEFEADTWGSKFSFARISTITKFLMQNFSASGEKLDLYEDFGFIFYALFKQIEELERTPGASVSPLLNFRRTHPAPIVRAWFMKAAVYKAIKLVAKVEGIDSIDLKNRFWTGIRRGRRFFGDGALTVFISTIYYGVGVLVYPLVLTVFRPKKLI